MVDEPVLDDRYFDHIADRAKAFSDLLVQVGEIKDKDLKAEGMLMLRAVRMSFKTVAQGDLATVTRLGKLVNTETGP